MLGYLWEILGETAKGKKWYLYVPLWFFAVYLFAHLLFFKLGSVAPENIIAAAYSLNTNVHEISHLIFSLAGNVPMLLAGSAAELVLATFFIALAFWVRAYFLSVFFFLWFMLTAMGIADYMADANSMALTLGSFNTDPTHDWNVIFDAWGVLGQAGLIAGVMRTIGIGAGVFGLVYSGSLTYLAFQDWRVAHKTKRSARRAKKQAKLQPNLQNFSEALNYTPLVLKEAATEIAADVEKVVEEIKEDIAQVVHTAEPVPETVEAEQPDA